MACQCVTAATSALIYLPVLPLHSATLRLAHKTAFLLTHSVLTIQHLTARSLRLPQWSKSPAHLFPIPKLPQQSAFAPLSPAFC